MSYMKNKKVKKNLAIPEWISDMITESAEELGGMNVVVSAAVMAFYNLKPEEKAKYLKQYREREIDESLGLTHWQSGKEIGSPDFEKGKADAKRAVAIGNNLKKKKVSSKK